MKTLPEKLNYKGQKRIAIINSPQGLVENAFLEYKDMVIDSEIDQRYPYQFMMLFVRSISDVRELVPLALHNLSADGVLWFCYPKKSSGKFKSDLERDHGWKPLNDAGFYCIRIVSIDQDWSALRFRNIKNIRSTSGRYPSAGK